MRAHKMAHSRTWLNSRSDELAEGAGKGNWGSYKGCSCFQPADP